MITKKNEYTLKLFLCNFSLSFYSLLFLFIPSPLPLLTRIYSTKSSFFPCILFPKFSLLINSLLSHLQVSPRIPRGKARKNTSRIICLVCVLLYEKRNNWRLDSKTVYIKKAQNRWQTELRPYSYTKIWCQCSMQYQYYLTVAKITEKAVVFGVFFKSKCL